MPKLVAPGGKAIVIRSVRANAGLAALYRARLEREIDEMHRSTLYWVKAAWRASGVDAPMAHDASPVAGLKRAMRKLAERWENRMARGSDELAEWFAQETKDYADRSLNGILRRAGFSVRFKWTKRLRTAYEAVAAEQIGLIKSIPKRYHEEVQRIVLQGVQRGRKLDEITDQLTERYNVTRSRAALIARDQNNKATAVIVQERQKWLGITQARWKHSHAGKVPRPEHKAADGTLFDINKGMFLEGKWTWPGVEINCRCTSESVIPGLD